MVTLIDEQSRKLNDLASRLLSAGNLDVAEFQPQCEAVFVSDLVTAAIGTVCPEESRGRFACSIPRDEVPVLADRKLMSTALAQLVDNAVKYSEPASPIGIAVAVVNQEVTVTIESQGDPISPADCERVFDRFYRAAGAPNRPPGTGLGLSIVKRIVDAHRGRVWAESGAGGRSIFAIALPATARRFMTSQGNILITDDEPDLRRALNRTLHALGFEITEAANGEQALERMENGRFHAVLLDINMPGIGGIEACRKLRRMAPGLQILMLTVRDSEGDKVRALDAGADDFITKPFSIPELAARLRSAVRRAQTALPDMAAPIWIGDIRTRPGPPHRAQIEPRRAPHSQGLRPVALPDGARRRPADSCAPLARGMGSRVWRRDRIPAYLHPPIAPAARGRSRRPRISAHRDWPGIPLPRAVTFAPI